LSGFLYWDGEIRCRYQVKPRGHSELILSQMDELLKEAGVELTALDAIAFGRGPGSFTGVRIAVGVAQGTAFGADLPVVPVSTLASLAQRHFRENGVRRILPAFDARMNEVYWGGYIIDDHGLAMPCFDDEVSAPDAVTLPQDGNWHGVGSGWQAYETPLRERLKDGLASVQSDLLCSAEDVALLAAAGFTRGEAVAAEHALPVYLRDDVARKPRG
jgi:tRNA threonylcarbamoyladenosine biosynthesis protein TsaB